MARNVPGGGAVMFYQWSESMSVGLPLIDNDHKALIHLVNRLHEAVSAGDTYDVLDDLLNRLVDYIDIHFTREERVMDACAYPQTIDHKEEHAAFVDYIRSLREQFTADSAAGLAGDLTEYLKDWLNHHILIQDMAYRQYAENNADAARIAEAFGPGLFDKMRNVATERR
jgi:hemerythrin